MLSGIFSETFFKKLSALQIAARKSFLGLRQGAHLSPRKGHGIEFSQYRAYEPGDSPRLIDWNTFARTDRLYIKQYHEEETLQVVTLIDGSASMSVNSKINIAIDISTAIGYVALNQKDSLIGSVLGINLTPNASSSKSLYQFRKYLSVKTDNLNKKSNFSYEVKKIIATLKFPGILFLLSDFLLPITEIEEALLTIRAKNFQCHLIQIIPKSDFYPFEIGESVELKDAETDQTLLIDWDDDKQKQYHKNIQNRIGEVSSITKNFGMGYHVFNENNQNIEDFILNSLMPKGGLL
jgi:hypothetical protein